MYDGAITMFKSDLETNGKLHSKQIEDSMNHCYVFQNVQLPSDFPSYDG
jgi:hypothetical protein